MIRLLPLLLLLLCGGYGAQAQTYAPMQSGETIASAVVLSAPLPVTVGGTTAGYQNDYDEDCPYPGSGAPDVVYAFTPAAGVTVDIDLCGSAFDTKVYLYENAATPGIPFDCNDDYYFGAPCGLYVSKIEGVQLTGGNTYFIVIDGSTTADYGAYTMTLRETPPPGCTWGEDLICPEGAEQENETCGTESNGGCTMPSGTETWVAVPANGGAVCSTTWANGGNRDSDWFELVLTTPSNVVLTANADREMIFGLAATTTPGAPICATLTGSISPAAIAGPCSQSSLDLGIMNVGTYWFIAELSEVDGLPCPNHYWIEFEVIPVSCPPPAELTVSQVIPSAATLGWTESGSATSWEYQYGVAGFTPGATGTATSLNPVALSGLSPNTSYDFYVRADCGAGLQSDWTGPLAFKTPCNAVVALPWSEDFDELAATGNNILPDCWKAESYNSTPWSTGDAAASSASDPCSSPNYAFVSYTPWGTDKFLITPGFTLTSGNSYDFSFNWVGDGNSGWMGSAMVNAYPTGTGAVALGLPFLSPETVAGSTCHGVTRSFIPPVSGTYYFILRISNGILQDALGFDDFSLGASPACPGPVDLTATAITAGSANLGWSPGGSEAAWEYSYGVSPYSMPAGPGIATGSNTINLISGLAPDTPYQFYVRAACGPGYSSWSGPYSFHTMCGAISTFPASEGFEADWPPTCWQDPEQGDYGWDQGVFGAAHSGNNWAYCNLAGAGLTSPPFQLNSNTCLVFYFRVEDQAYPQDLNVRIGNQVLYQISGATNTVYEKIVIPLAAYTGQTVAITFECLTGSGGADFGICLDDVALRKVNEWTGNAGVTWNNLANWSMGSVPDMDDVVMIPAVPAGGNFPVVHNGITAECGYLTLESGATVTVQAGGLLRIIN